MYTRSPRQRRACGARALSRRSRLHRRLHLARPTAYAGLTLGAACIHLRKDALSSPGIVCFICTGLDTLFEQFMRNGANIAAPITVEPYGMREFAVTDIDGHQLIFGESTHTESTHT
jgi:hypothetical protein